MKLSVLHHSKCTIHCEHSYFSLTIPACHVIGIVCLSSPCNYSGFFICMRAVSNINHITCVQSFHVHQSVCNGHHFVNHTVSLVHYIITVKVEMNTFVSDSLYDIIRVGKASCSMSVLFGYGNCLCGMHFDQYISEVSIFSISKLFIQYV